MGSAITSPGADSTVLRTCTGEFRSSNLLGGARFVPLRTHIKKLGFDEGKKKTARLVSAWPCQPRPTARPCEDFPKYREFQPMAAQKPLSRKIPKNQVSSKLDACRKNTISWSA